MSEVAQGCLGAFIVDKCCLESLRVVWGYSGFFRDVSFTVVLGLYRVVQGCLQMFRVFDSLRRVV